MPKKSLLAGAVLGASLMLPAIGGSTAWAQTATGLVCNKCVHTGDIADGAVRTTKIAAGAVTSSRIANGAVNAAKLARDLIPEHVLVVNADGSEASNCDDLRATLATAGSMASASQKVVVFADAGTYDCRQFQVIVYPHVILRGAGAEATFIQGRRTIFPLGVVGMRNHASLQDINVFMQVPSGVSTAVAIADSPNHHRRMTLKNVNAEAVSDLGFTFAILFDEASCTGGCTERIFENVTSTSRTISGSTTDGILLSAEGASMNAQMIEVTASGIGGSSRAFGIEQSTNVDMVVTRSTVIGTSANPAAELSIGLTGGAGSTFVTHSIMTPPHPNVRCSFVTDPTGNLPVNVNGCPTNP